MSTFGATTVRSLGRANLSAFENTLTGALPLRSGAGTLVSWSRTRRNSMSGKP